MIDGYDKRLVISINKELVVTLGCFLISLANSITLLIATLFLSIYLCLKYRNGVGAVKALIFITIRTVISIGLAPNYDAFAAIKWALIILLSGMIYLSCIGKTKEYNYKFVYFLLGYFFFLVVENFFWGGYPVVSTFKAFAWVFVFIAIILAVANNRQVPWIAFVTWYLNIIIITSPLSFMLGIAYLRNGHGFQGITNQPNMFGVLTCLAFALNLYFLQKKISIGRIILLSLCVIGCILSESRTGMICIVICFVVYVSFSQIAPWKKMAIIAITLILMIVLLSAGFGNAAQGFLYKWQNGDNILYSRENQIESALIKFEQNPWFGTGFMVPFNSGPQSFSFSFDFIEEPGNLVIMLLGDTGIIGTILFFLLYLSMFIKMEKRKLLLFLIPLLVSMGEMIFFSTNNIAILYYVLYAVCLVPDYGRCKKTPCNSKKCP